VKSSDRFPSSYMLWQMSQTSFNLILPTKFYSLIAFVPTHLLFPSAKSCIFVFPLFVGCLFGIFPLYGSSTCVFFFFLVGPCLLRLAYTIFRKNSISICSLSFLFLRPYLPVTYSSLPSPTHARISPITITFLLFHHPHGSW
jgi:hypothetical protein